MWTRVLVTGAGGPSAVAFMKALRGEPFSPYAADIDPYAVGLYLVPHEHRVLVPRGSDPDFVSEVLRHCQQLGIDVLVPTVDTELTPCAAARARFEAAGVKVLVAEESTLRVCVDKLQLLRACSGVVPLPRFAVFNGAFTGEGWEYPLIVKPRSGAGGRGIVKIASPAELAAAERGDHLLVEEFLPGTEYSVDVLADSAGSILSVVPRQRLKVDSGVAVASRTLHDPTLIEHATAVAKVIGLTYVANIQFRCNAQGVPSLLEVNARFPGTMSHTVESGVNMPLIALQSLLGRPIAGYPLTFRETVMVRHWEESYPDPLEFATMENQAGKEARARTPGRGRPTPARPIPRAWIPSRTERRANADRRVPTLTGDHSKN